MRIFFFFKQKTAYEMRISDWSSDVCSSDLSAALFDASLSSSVEASLVITSRRIAATLLRLANHCRRMRVSSLVASVLSSIPARVAQRSEARRVGKECVSTCRSRWSPYHSKKNIFHQRHQT